MINAGISLSNEIIVKLKSLPKIIAVDPLYTPTFTSGNELQIYGTNFEQNFTFLIINQLIEVEL